MTFSTGLSSLRAHQTALSVVGNNIANASTEGFRREDVVFVERPHISVGQFSIGTGVAIDDVRSVGNAALEGSLLDAASNNAALSTKLQAAKRIEALFLPGTGTLQERTEQLFTDLERLSALPTDATLRSSVLHSAQQVTGEVNRLSNEIASLVSQNEIEIQQTVSQLETRLEHAAKLHLEVKKMEGEGRSVPALRLQRDTAIRELAELVDVKKQIDGNGNERFLVGEGMFSIDGGIDALNLKRAPDGRLELWREGCDRPHQLQTGKLAGLMSQYNEPGGLKDVQDKLEEFTKTLVHTLDTIHATGVGIGGGFNILSSGRTIEDVNAILSSQDTVSPITSGELYVSVKEEASGNTTLHKIEISPDTDSLSDVAADLDAIANVTANLSSGGRLSISAAPGFTFNFTGNLQTVPDTSAITGTTEPTISGRYQNDSLDEYTYQFVGSGTIGVTEGLRLEVRDKAGVTFRIMDVGTNYEPGSKLTVANGVELSLSSGTVNNGDEFSSQMPGTPDTTGILAALGLNTMFLGNDAATLKVDPRLQENPSLLATTTNGDPSDTRNLHRMIAARDALTMRNKTVSFEQYLADMAGDAGREVAELQRDLTAQEEQTVALQSELDSINGVDVNEELAKMLQYQRAYQAAARYISTVDETLQTLIGIV